MKTDNWGPGWAPLVSFRGENNRGWQLRRRGGDQWTTFTVRGTSGGDDEHGKTRVNNDEWHHVCGTYDGAERRLYVDGLIDFKIDDTGEIGNFNANDEVVIGARTQNNTSGNAEAFTNAAIDEVRIYSRALGHAEVTQLMDYPRASARTPFNTQIGAPVDTKLIWDPGIQPNPGPYTKHKLYLGKSYDLVVAEDASVFAGEFTDVNEYTPPAPLENDMRYWWKIVEVGPPDQESAVWHFWTASLENRGRILREVWTGIGGADLPNLRNHANYPDNPNLTEWVTSLENPRVNYLNDFGTRMQGWLHPLTSGEYTFFLSSDDDCDLFLSPDRYPSNATRIAFEDGSSGVRDWQNGNEMSDPIYLEGGEKYYICLEHKEGGGGDNASIAWEGPDQPIPVLAFDGQAYGIITGGFLSPFVRYYADNPDPANGEIRVESPVTLKWRAGVADDADTPYASQNVYFGTDPENLEFKANVSVDEYGPLAVEYYKWYYWRVDGVPTVGDPVIGGVFAFRATYDPAAIVDPNLVIWYEFDGDATDSSGYGNDGAEVGDPTYTASLVSDLDQAIDLDGDGDRIDTGLNASFFQIGGNNPRTVTSWVYTRAYNNGGIFDVGNRSGGQDFSLRTLTANDRWRIQYWGGDYDFSYPTQNEWVHFGLVHDGAYTKVYANGDLIVNWEKTINTPDTNPFQVGCYGWYEAYFDGKIDDFRLYNKALTAADISNIARINLAWSWNPDPGDGETGVDLNPTLSWTPGDYATGHRVMFGDDPAALVELPGQPQAPNSVAVGPLELGKVYYWAVDEGNTLADGGYDLGRIWKFTTSDYVTVEDFEFYDWDRQLGEDANYVYYTWVDGLANFMYVEDMNGNGSGANLFIQEVTYVEAIRGLRFDYSNTGFAENPRTGAMLARDFMYSMARANTADLPSGIGSDWTAGGAKVLSIPFYGDSLNELEPMWVELEDGAGRAAKVTYGAFDDEEPNDINEGWWHDWYISLQDFNDLGIDLEDVNSIALGFGDVPAVEAGGVGIVHFDEIRLYGAVCVLARRAEDFAEVDYVEDCVINYEELDVMFGDWLDIDFTTEAVTPDPCGLALWLKLDGDVTDSSGNDRHGVAIGAPTYVAGVDGQAIDLSGTGDSISVDHGTIATDVYSIAMWLKSRDHAGYTGGYRSVMHTDTWSAGNIHLHFRTGLHVQFDWNGGFSSANTPDLVEGEWHHLTMIADRTGTPAWTEMFLDGVSAGVTTGSASALVLGDLDFGSYQENDRWWNGQFDDIQVYDYALSANEVLGARGLGSVYTELTSPANLSDDEPINEKIVNFKDYDVLLSWWLMEDFLE